jgi:hypothetical protein
MFRNPGAVPAVVQDVFFLIFEIRYQMRQKWKKIRCKKTLKHLYHFPEFLKIDTEKH